MTRIVCAMLFMFLLGVFPGFSSGGREAAKEAVELEFVLTESEYTSQLKEIWNIYETENPHVTIKMAGWNIGEDAVYEARIAAGDAPHMWETIRRVNKDNYKMAYNLLELDYPYWDKFIYDVKKQWGTVEGVENFLPVLGVWMPYTRSYCFHQDEMKKTGLDPKNSVKTMADLEEFLNKLKSYVESDPKLQYVLDTGWHPNGWGRPYTYAYTHSFAGLDEQYDVWQGRIRWDDAKKNPYAKTLAFFKKLYDDGILPQKWWTRQWKQEYETGFIARKSLITWHGPWIWDKVLAADADAKLDGFPIPPYQNGKTLHESNSGKEGTLIFAGHEEKPLFKELTRAFVWWNSPETIKMKSEAIGKVPALDMSDVGQPDIQTLQYKMVVKPFYEGYFGNWKWESRIWPDFSVAKYRIKGTPAVLADDAMAAVWGDYMEGKISLDDFLDILQARWEKAYKF